MDGLVAKRSIDRDRSIGALQNWFLKADAHDRQLRVETGNSARLEP